VAPFIAVDQEGGEVTRIRDSVPLLPGQMALGAAGSPALAERAGRALGGDLRRLGVTLNLAPVVDVGLPHATIDIRSFGSDPDDVSALAAAFIRGQSDAGVASTAKHFPGLGAATVDSHRALPVLDLDLAELRRTHLPPFKAAIEAGVDAIMLGHVALPRIDSERPASISPRIISLLRDELGFDGILITDALEMRALHSDEGGAGALAVRSIAAGADVAMTSTEGEEVLAALRRAAHSGELTDARIRTSLRRILRVKLRRAPQTRADRDVAREIAARAVTLVRNRGNVVPLRRKMARVAYIGPAGAIASSIGARSELHPPVRFDEPSAAAWQERARAAVRDADMIVAVAQNRSQTSLVATARASNREAPMVFVSLGSPALIELLPDADAYLCAYGSLETSQAAVADVLTGLAPAPGKLPVTPSKDLAP
jgi:beta-N-acetylhexosaminidase